MKSGFTIVSVISGYSPYVLAGWAETDGLDVVMRNCVVIRRFGQNKALAELAVEGPAHDTKSLPMSNRETIWRPLISRAIPADAKKWKQYCPKPRGFVVDEELESAASGPFGDWHPKGDVETAVSTAQSQTKKDGAA